MKYLYRFIILFLIVISASTVQAKGDDTYIHTEHDDNCNECHSFPAMVHEFVPDLRINQEGTIVSVLNVQGNACTLYTGAVVSCDTLFKPPELAPCGYWQIAKARQ